MAVREILQEGAEILRRLSTPVEKFDEELRGQITDLFETLESLPEGDRPIGLAAPQVGYSIRLIVVDIPGWFRGALINPTITRERGQQRSVEGCFSISRLKWDQPVARSKLIEVIYLDPSETVRRLKAHGLLSACLQHEIDHLDGILFIDRVAKGITHDITPRMGRRRSSIQSGATGR